MTNLDPETTQRTLRRLHGEPQQGGSAVEADRVHADRVHADRAHADRVERLWRALEPPPATEPPPDFAVRTADALRRRSDAGSWSVAPAWARGTAAAALAAGLLLGVGVGHWSPAETAPAPSVETVDVETVDLVDGLGPDSPDWTEEDWGKAWNRAFDTSFGSPENDS